MAYVRKFRPLHHQRPFFESTARFPAFVSGWATGKSVCLIMKAMELSHLYVDNYGMICRKTYKSLTKSTIKDFEKWTGYTVPQNTQEVKIKGTNSAIFFSHAEDIIGLHDMLQNMNLGWVAIEQADEMENSEAFDLLEGRIRRIITPNALIQQKLIKMKVLKELCPDFEMLSTRNRERAEKAIKNELGLPVRQLITVANTCGHNWMWNLWKYDPKEDFDLCEANSFQNQANIPKETLKSWLRMKERSPKTFNRYVMNSWEDYDLEGAYYASLMSDALKQHRVGMTTLFEPASPVYTFWDLGLRASDTTAIWFVQFIGNEIWLVDYYENFGEGIDYYSAELDRRRYTYGGHYLPPDVVSRMQSSNIESRLDILRSLRREPIFVVERHKVEERIEAARSILPRCKFSEKCRRGVEALNHYRRKRNEIMSTEQKPWFMNTPLHDWASNGADAFGYMAIVYRNQPIGDAILGYRGANPEWIEGESDVGVTDLLEVA